ncbi:MAG: GTP-binding protein [Nanoarchaeota archaeon]
MKKTPISIITGYLGAGKTTLLKDILLNSSKKIAVIMNEFGEIDIDSKIIKGKNVKIAELAGGCVCCSLTGEFEAATKEIIKKYKPDLIVVETTGLAEPDALIFDIENELPDLKLDSIITLVDCDNFFKIPMGRTGKIQIEMADIALLNKVDLVDKKELKKLESEIKKINPRSNIIKTKFAKADQDLLFGIYSKKDIEEISHEHADNVEFFVFESNKSINKDKFEKLIKIFPKEVFRLKGFVKLGNKFYLLNYVAQKYSLEEFKADKTQLVFIGENISKVKEKILKQLNSL